MLFIFVTPTVIVGSVHDIAPNPLRVLSAFTKERKDIKFAAKILLFMVAMAIFDLP